MTDPVFKKGDKVYARVLVRLPPDDGEGLRGRYLRPALPR